MRSSIEIIKSIFRDYYSRIELDLPHDFYVREFAFQPFELNTYIRHLSFQSKSELKKFLTDRPPRHVYFSSAKYKEPANPVMEEKGWMGSDLIFDIDADHVPDCEDKVMEFYFCQRCGYTSQQKQPRCPRCGAELKLFEHVPSECIDKAKEYLAKLIDVVENDLGYRNMKAVFSGHRGFHLFVELPEADSLMTSDMRREIVSYLKLESIDINSLMIEYVKVGRKKLLRLPPRVTDGGIRRRIALELVKRIRDPDVKGYVLGRVSRIDMHKLAKICSELNNVMQSIIKELTIPIDEKVTIDISRLVRIPKSINGKSGWIVTPIKNLDVSTFILDSVSISPCPDTLIKIRFLVDIPRMQILDREMKFKRGEEVILESAYALYFTLKDVAMIVTMKR